MNTNPPQMTKAKKKAIERWAGIAAAIEYLGIEKCNQSIMRPIPTIGRGLFIGINPVGFLR